DRRLHDIGDGPIESPRQPGRALLELRRAAEIELGCTHRPAATLLLGELRPALVPCPCLPRRASVRAGRAWKHRYEAVDIVAHACALRLAARSVAALTSAHSASISASAF